MLPNFLIIGAEKAATTWLARGLSEHPSAYLPPEKEIFFFSSRFDRGLEWYASHFRGWAGEPLVGEATPVYLSHPEAPARIQATLGQIRLVVSLRQPVDRAYSAFWHNLRRGRLSPDADFADCVATDACEMRSRGEYATHLGRYLAVFPRGQVLVLVYEQIGDDAARELGRCLDFLGLEQPFAPSVLHARLNEGGKDITAATGPVRVVRSALRSALLGSVRRGLIPTAVEQRLVPAAGRIFGRLAHGVGPRSRPYETLSETLRSELLERYYLEQIHRLEDLLEADLGRWYDGQAAGNPAPDVEPARPGRAQPRLRKVPRSP